MRVAALLALAACGYSKLAELSDAGSVRDSGAPNIDASDSDALDDVVTVQQVQNDAMRPGTPVHLHGVIVTAIDTFGVMSDDLWVEEPGGGEFSGVAVFSAQAAQIDVLSVGDVVDITSAVKTEFALSSDTSGRTDTILDGMPGMPIEVQKIGTAAVPAPAMVDALMIGLMPEPARSAAWEPWEGVLITVRNVTGEVPAALHSDLTDQSFPITGAAEVESSIAPFPTGIAKNSCLASVTGVLDYFFTYNLLVTSTAGVVLGGVGCPPLENTIASCKDGKDNDGNGLVDCADPNCAGIDGC